MVFAKRLLIIFLVSVARFNGFTADRYIPDEYSTIQEAINAAAAGDVIWVRPGLYIEGIKFGGKDVAVRSLEGPRNTILRPPYSERAAVIGPAGELSGLTISNAFSAVEAVGTGSIIRSNLFIKNYRSTIGVAVSGNWASPRIEQNTFMFNEDLGNSYGSGLLVFVNGSAPQIINNLFVSNNCAGISLILPEGTSALVLNNTFVANQRTIFHWSLSPITYRNNILVSNEVGFIYESGQPPIWNNNLTYGNGANLGPALGGQNNISKAPEFYDAARGDYRLTRNSPAIDAGSEGSNVDITGRARPIDGNLDGAAKADIGAYEYLAGPPAAPTITNVRSSPESIQLSWRVEPETETYLVYRGDAAGGPYSEIGRTTALTFADQTAEMNKEYFYVVAGMNDRGTGGYSTEAPERGGNRPPEAVADYLEVAEDSSVVIEPLLNDSDPNGDMIWIDNARGTGITFTTNRIYFTPATNFWGTNIIEYVITDGRSFFATNQITVRVLPVNDPPTVWEPTPYGVQIEGVYDIQLTGWDIDSRAFTFEVVREPDVGRVEVIAESGRIRYFAGRSPATSDSFSVRAFDGEDYSAPAEIKILRLPLEDKDRDGLPDYWELQFDLNNATADRDGDGSTSTQEYFANTDPNDPASVLKIDSMIVGEDGSIRLQWRAIGNIRYRLQTASSPSGPFTDLVRPSNEEVFPGRDGEAGVADIQIPASMESMEFFRVKVGP